MSEIKSHVSRYTRGSCTAKVSFMLFHDIHCGHTNVGVGYLVVTNAFRRRHATIVFWFFLKLYSWSALLLTGSVKAHVAVTINLRGRPRGHCRRVLARTLVANGYFWNMVGSIGALFDCTSNKITERLVFIKGPYYTSVSVQVKPQFA